MPIEILMPALSPTMKEGNLARWLKKEGDTIKAGDVIAEIETDKATMEVEAVDEGTLGKIIISEGSENVAVNSLIALILEEGEDKSKLESYQLKQTENKEVKKDNAVANKEEVKNIESPKIIEPKKVEIPVISKINNSDRIKGASPLAKRVAQEQNINLSDVVGTGPNGRIIKEDVINSKNNSKSGVVRRNPQEYEVQKNGNIRKVIAQRLLASKQNVPHFYLSLDLRIDKLLDLRQDINNNAQLVNDKPAYKVSVNDMIIKAVALALKEVPAANSSWTDEAILLYNNVDISVAVAINDGLITPIIKNADQKSIIAISEEMKSLIKKAKDGKLQPEEFQGGGFSISNLGMYGIDNFNAIINPPQSCILAVGSGVKKPVVDNDQIVVGNVMNVTLSCDHRSVDGAVGAQFLSAFRKVVENPVVMLLK